MKNNYENYYLELDIYRSDGHVRRMLHSHCHPYYELSFIIEGDLTVLFDDKNYTVTEPSVILSPPDTNHYMILNGGEYHRYNIYFTEDVFLDLHQYKIKLNDVFQKGGRVLVLKNDAIEHIKTYIDHLKTEESKESKSLLMALIINTLLFHSDVSTIGAESYIDDVMRIILREYSQKLVAEELAARFFVSRTKLMTDFKARIGKTLAEQITFVRVEQARAALKRGERVMSVAHTCGFGNAANFSRVFKNTIGMPPKKYQKMILSDSE